MAIEDDEKATPVVDLQTVFRYQNHTTGEVSNVTLTAQQMCRFLCPADSKTKLQHITPDTNILQQLPDGSYAPWRTAKMVPVLKESCSSWFKYSKDAGVSETPRTCRQLLEDDPLLLERKQGDHVQYSSECTNSEWKTLQMLPNLRKALEALYTVQPKPIESNQSSDPANDSIQHELEAFLSSTGDVSRSANPEEEGYESDGGTRYVKDAVSGRWVHEKLARAAAKQQKAEAVPSKPKEQEKKDGLISNETKKRKRKGRFSARKGRNWIYVTGLPLNCTEIEITEQFQKAGILDLDPETQKPKVKLYRHKADQEKGLKGDASICYARPESVNLAITLFDGATLRLNEQEPLMSVSAAKFEQHGTEFDPKRTHISEAKRKVAKMAAVQAMDWDEGEFNGRLTGGRKGLRIIVLKHMFDAAEMSTLPASKESKALAKLEEELKSECEGWGATIEKMTVFTRNPEGVIVLKFAQPGAASEVVKQMNGRKRSNQIVDASFWDGKTDYTVRDEEALEKEADQRHEAFGNWLDNQDLPEEFQLQSE